MHGSMAAKRKKTNNSLGIRYVVGCMNLVTVDRCAKKIKVTVDRDTVTSILRDPGLA